ncbi:MAG: molybdopterin biosynthesis protein MoeY [Burkholderiales bacterium]
MPEATTLEKILDLARWAPSGDNTQPWRFEITGEYALTVHGFDTRLHCVYDFDGHPSQISLGALLETLTIAASGCGLRTEISRRMDAPDEQPTFDVRLVTDDALSRSPLIESITKRAVQRRVMRRSPLDAEQKSALEASVGAGYSIVWRESFAERVRMALLLYRSARIRLTMPEAFQVHRDVIEFGARYSEDRIPDQAVGLDPLATSAMRWMMNSWPRMRFFNTYLGGTVLPRIELDLLPGVACAAHFVITADTPPSSTDDFVAAGAALQRFWLTATRLGLFLQPEMTPLIFSWYVRAGRRFSVLPSLWNQASALTRQWQDFLGADIMERAVFCGRAGTGPAPSARSLRLPLQGLIMAKTIMQRAE